MPNALPFSVCHTVILPYNHMALSMPLHVLRIYIHNNNEKQEDNKTRAYLVQRATIAIVFVEVAADIAVAVGVACAVIVQPENLAKDCGCNVRSATPMRSNWWQLVACPARPKAAQYVHSKISIYL